MHGGFGTLREVVDLPFIARRSTRTPADTRRHLGLPLDRPLVLLSFGGYGLQRIDLGAVGGLAGYTVVVTADVTANRRANEVPSGAGSATFADNVRLVDEHGLYRDGLRYEDLVAAVDVVLTKPGYGIIAECVANDTAIVYTSRGHFVEYRRAGSRDAEVAAMRVHLERGPAGRTLAARARRDARAAGATERRSASTARNGRRDTFCEQPVGARLRLYGR